MWFRNERIIFVSRGITVLGTNSINRTSIARRVKRSAQPRPQARTHARRPWQEVSYFKLYAHTDSKFHLCSFIHYNYTSVYSTSFYLFFCVLLMAVIVNYLFPMPWSHSNDVCTVGQALKWAAEGLGKAWARASTNTVSVTIAQDVLRDDSTCCDKQLAGLSVSDVTLVNENQPQIRRERF